MSRPPHFLLVCGAWHTPECWDAVRQQLTRANHPATAIALPSTGVTPGAPTDQGDIDFIRKTARDLCEQGEDVIAVLHSFAGQLGSDAVSALDKKERQKEGLPGGVVRIVTVAGYIVPEGYQDATPERPEPPVDWLRWDREDNTVTVTLEGAKQYLYNDMPDDEAEKWAKKLLTWSNGSRLGVCGSAGWRTIPTTYVICTNDISPFGPYERAMVEGAQASSPCAVDTVEEIDAAHCPMISKPDEVTRILLKAGKASSSGQSDR